MAQVFRPRANAFVKLGFLALATVLVLGTTVLAQINTGRWETGEHDYVEQPVAFSHEHHVSGLGIDCRYCHTSVEETAFAGMPPTHTCMSCHSQIWTESEMLQPVRESYRTGTPIKWNRVHNLPGYVYFNHSVHVTQGVGCESCHGRIDQMPLVYQAESLHMQWCLDCHRAPEEHLRPNELIYAFGYSPPREEQLRIGRALVEAYDIDVGRLTTCSTCHR